MIQDIIAIAIALAAAVYVGRTFWRSLLSGRTPSCGSCGGCGSSQQPLVQIEIAKK